MGGSKILVVDDNQDFCDSMKDVLEIEGHEVVAAYGGQSAVELSQKESFDLILMDLVMPGMDGPTAIKLIRRISPSVPIIIVTGFGEETSIQEALRAGVNGKFEKPVDFAGLLAGIESSVAGSKGNPPYNSPARPIPPS